MKKIILSSLTILTITSGVISQNVTIPDINFKSYLIGNPLINTNGDTEIQVSEANTFTGEINCESLSISNLTGIEHFIALTILNCSDNNLTNLDISNNINLIKVYSNINSLTSLDITNNTSLTHLDCHANYLTALYISNNTNLISLGCAINSLTSLDLSSNINLENLNCSSNPLGNLDISNNTGLTYLLCVLNSLTNLDLSNNPNLIYLDCFKNSLTSLDISNNANLGRLDCSINSLTNFISSNSPSLTEFNCSSNSLINLDILNNTGLTKLDCSRNSLTNLDISNNTNLIRFVCANNTLTNLDVSNNLSLTELYCNNNSLNSLDLANGANNNLLGFNASINPNLTCIKVDDAVYSTTNWTNIDQQSSFNTNCPGFVGVNETIVSELKLYPNPVQNELFIEVKKGKIEIIDFSGKIVKTITNPSTKSINVFDLYEGIYILKLTTDKGIYINQFIKN